MSGTFKLALSPPPPLFKPGDRVLVAKPHDVHEAPSWTGSMDRFAGKTCTVSVLSRWVELIEGLSYNFSPRWLTLQNGCIAVGDWVYPRPEDEKEVIRQIELANRKAAVPMVFPAQVRSIDGSGGVASQVALQFHEGCPDLFMRRFYRCAAPEDATHQQVVREIQAMQETMRQLKAQPGGLATPTSPAACSSTNTPSVDRNHGLLDRAARVLGSIPQDVPLVLQREAREVLHLIYKEIRGEGAQEKS